MATKTGKKYLRNYDTYDRNSNGKSVLSTTANWKLQIITITTVNRKGNMAAKTGNDFIPLNYCRQDENSDSKFGFIDHGELEKDMSVRLRIYEKDRLPATAVWPPKPEIFISLEL